MDIKNALATAAKGAVQSTVEWAYTPRRPGDRNRKNGGKSDPAFQEHPLDTLRRAAYHSVFDTLFLSPDPSGYPYITPDTTLQDVVGKLSDWIFPTETVFKTTNEALQELFDNLLEQIKFDLKTEKIVEESAVMGYCGLRSVWDVEQGIWLYEIKPKEYLVIETPEGKPEQTNAIGLEWPIIRMEKGKESRYWRKERWTIDTYQLWRALPEKTPGQKPEFKPEDIEKEESNDYGELAITVVPHYYDPECKGRGIVQEAQVLTVKALIRLHFKEHFAHLKYMDPNPVRKNHANPDDALNLSIGNVIDLQQANEAMPTDLTLLEYAGIPESAEGERYRHEKALYRAAKLKPPPPDEMNKPGVENSGVALRLIDKDDAKTVQTLRDNGYSQVLKHFEKILRMGARLGLPEYSAINPEDRDSYGVTAQFPDFFPPTDDEIAIKLANFKAANLPSAIMAPMIAALFGIEDPAIIAAIAVGVDEEREALKPTTNIGA